MNGILYGYKLHRVIILLTLILIQLLSLTFEDLFQLFENVSEIFEENGTILSIISEF